MNQLPGVLYKDLRLAQQERHLMLVSNPAMGKRERDASEPWDYYFITIRAVWIYL